MHRKCLYVLNMIKLFDEARFNYLIVEIC